MRHGIIGGILVAAYFGILYASDKSLFLNPGLQWASLVIYIAAMYLATREDCAQNGATRDFRTIVRTPFLVFLLINLAYWLFYYGLHLFDKELIVRELDGQISFFQKMLESGMGDPSQAAKVREQLADLQKAREQPVQPLAPVLAQMGQGAVGGFALAAGIAALFRRT